ncbi:MAG: helix-turn-helix transcriptional regulator [Myxococcales bacterium]|nr:helix-turn-helix transcriptional regulator [Myxococcales bacterium]
MAADELDRFIAKRSQKNPKFPLMVKAAKQRKAIARKFVQIRENKGGSQTLVAARMRTSASIVSRLESGADARISTIQKYAEALGCELQIELVAKKH